MINTLRVFKILHTCFRTYRKMETNIRDEEWGGYAGDRLARFQSRLFAFEAGKIGLDEALYTNICTPEKTLLSFRMTPYTSPKAHLFEVVDYFTFTPVDHFTEQTFNEG